MQVLFLNIEEERQHYKESNEVRKKKEGKRKYKSYGYKDENWKKKQMQRKKTGRTQENIENKGGGQRKQGNY